MNKNEILKKDLELLKETKDYLLRINNTSTIHLKKYIKKINKVENDTFFLTNLKDIDILSSIKKLLEQIDKNNQLFNKYKYLLFNVLSRLEDLYTCYILNENYEKVELELNSLEKEITEIITKKNSNKKYYYIKIKLNKKIPYFYLSRRIILINISKYAKAYNYVPLSLDDDSYDYFIIDVRADKNTNILDVMKKLKDLDEAILDYKIYQVVDNNSLYNIKFYTTNSCLLLNEEFVDSISYKDFYDCYIECKNQREAIEKILDITNNSIYLISLKKISDREVKLFLPQGLNSSNIKNIKEQINIILVDKNISEILYSKFIDFTGFQVLEYLRQKYNIEYGILGGEDARYY